MSEELKQEIDLLKEKVRLLEEDNQNLKAASTIPYEVDSALRERLNIATNLTTSAKGANSEDQAVNEGGVATYDVLGDPAGFLQVTIAGTVYYIPYYGA